MNLKTTLSAIALSAAATTAFADNHCEEVVFSDVGYNRGDDRRAWRSGI